MTLIKLQPGIDTLEPVKRNNNSNAYQLIINRPAAIITNITNSDGKGLEELVIFRGAKVQSEVTRFIEQVYLLPGETIKPQDQVQYTGQYQFDGEEKLRIALTGNEEQFKTFCSKVHSTIALRERYCYNLSKDGVFGLEPVMECIEFATAWICGFVGSIIGSTSEHVTEVERARSRGQGFSLWAHTCYMISGAVLGGLVAEAMPLLSKKFGDLWNINKIMMDKESLRTTMEKVLELVVSAGISWFSGSQLTSARGTSAGLSAAEITDYKNSIRQLVTDTAAWRVQVSPSRIQETRDRLASEIFMNFYQAAEDTTKFLRASKSIYAEFVAGLKFSTPLSAALVGHSAWKLARAGMAGRASVSTAAGAVGVLGHLIIGGVSAFQIYRSETKRKRLQDVISELIPIQRSCIISYVAIGCLYGLGDLTPADADRVAGYSAHTGLVNRLHQLMGPDADGNSTQQRLLSYIESVCDELVAFNSKLQDNMLEKALNFELRK